MFVQSVQLKRPFIVFGQPDIGEEEIKAVSDVLRSGWIGTGRVTKQFEDEFVKHMGGGYAVAVSSCSIGLTLALRASGVCRGDNVLTTPLTFCATVNSIIQIGANPVFSEVTEQGILDASKIRERHLQGNVWMNIHAIVPVNYKGISADVGRRLVPVVEDAAHSFGGNAGHGDITVFSFYATKNITSGEGGMIWTRDKSLADRCRLLSNHGQSSGAWGRYNSGPIENYQVLHPGYKGNLPDVLSAIGLVQLRRWNTLKQKRAAIWNVYESEFGKQKGTSQHLYTIRVRDRQKVREFLYNRGIGTGIHYEALHLQPAYKYLGYKRGDFLVAEKIGDETLSLPVSNRMTEEEARWVVRCVKEATK